VWTLDFPEDDPDSNYPAPTPRQLLYAEQARRELAHLKETLQRLTVPQQRAIITAMRDELVGGVFRREPLTIDPAGPNVTRLTDLRRRRRHKGPDYGLQPVEL
jgi:hypothetical protein